MGHITDKIKFFKFEKWWNYKIGGALFTYLLTKNLLFSFFISVQDIALIVVFFLLILVGFGINDYTDFEQDKTAGKNNLFNSLPLQLAPFYFGALALVILAFCWFFLSPVINTLLILLVILNYLYSVKPFRLKEHRYLSIVISGLYERAFPYFIIMLQIILSGKTSQIQFVFVGLYIVWSFLWECRNYMNGQLNDYESDEKSGVKSLVSSIGFSGVQSLKQKLFSAEIIFLLLWLLVAFTIDTRLLILPFFAVFLPFFHRIVQGGKIAIVTTKESIVDYVYNYAFIAAIAVFQILYGNTTAWKMIGLSLLLVFSSSHFRDTVAHIYAKIILRFYYFLFFLASSVVNYTIYYFRKYILRWSENRSRSIDHRIIFLHIPKTAGTTFNNILEKHFLPANVFTIKVVNDMYLNTDDFIAMSKPERERIYLLNGHQVFGLHRYMEGETKYITFLREPRERIVSFYYYTKQNRNLELGKLIQENNWDLYDFVANVQLKELNNAYLRLISGIDDTEEVMMATAIENIQKHFSFVGITEYFEESLARLQKIYGWEISDYVNYKVNEKRPKWNEIDEKTRKLIEEKNHGDILFYEQMKAVFLSRSQS